MPLLVEVTFLHVVGGNLSGQHLPYESEIGIKVVRMCDGLKGGRQQLLLRIAHQRTQGRVDLEPVSICSHQRHADSGILKRTAKTFLAFKKSIVRSPAFGGIFRTMT